MEDTTIEARRDVLRAADLDARELRQLLDLAARMTELPCAWTEALRGDTVILPTERRAVSDRLCLATAAHRLGMAALAVGPGELPLGRDETTVQAARELSRIGDLIAVRADEQETVEQVAAAATVPVVNLGSDSQTPIAALADLLAIAERFGDLRGVAIAYVGPGEAAHALMEACALTGTQLTIAVPPELPLSLDVLANAERLAAARGGELRLVEDAVGAVAGAHVVCGGSLPETADDGEALRRDKALARYRLDERLLEHAAPAALMLRSGCGERLAERTAVLQALLYALRRGDWTGAD